ncbi:MAG: hypothetical protein H6818_05035 [Phycisphaerales bacterium]|nr:hypothetical protein [Phycisphaerales bacterium]MCB9863451.1 hypothetical protein [Phycisphaerales bacterium]
MKQQEAADIDALISIRGQRELSVEAPHIFHQLALEFDDVEAPSQTDPLQASRIRLRQREAQSIGLRQRPPTSDDAHAIIDFADSIRHIDGALLCQCFAGISRSSAAALLCLSVWRGPGSERECIEYVRSVRPAAVPHLDLVAFGDDLLGRNGRLVEAVQAK